MSDTPDTSSDKIDRLRPFIIPALLLLSVLFLPVLGRKRSSDLYSLLDQQTENESVLAVERGEKRDDIVDALSSGELREAWDGLVKYHTLKSDWRAEDAVFLVKDNDNAVRSVTGKAIFDEDLTQVIAVIQNFYNPSPDNKSRLDSASRQMHQDGVPLFTRGKGNIVNIMDLNADPETILAYSEKDKKVTIHHNGTAVFTIQLSFPDYKITSDASVIFEEVRAVELLDRNHQVLECRKFDNMGNTYYHETLPYYNEEKALFGKWQQAVESSSRAALQR